MEIDKYKAIAASVVIGTPMAFGLSALFHWNAAERAKTTVEHLENAGAPPVVIEAARVGQAQEEAIASTAAAAAGFTVLTGVVSVGTFAAWRRQRPEDNLS